MQINVKKRKIIDRWVNYKPLSFKEKFIMSRRRPVSLFGKYKKKRFKNIEREYFNLINPHTITQDGFSISFRKSATDIINRLFNYYVTDDTLVISSKDEHGSVEKNIKKAKNLYMFLETQELSERFYEELDRLIEILQTQKFSNILIYLNGTRVFNGIATPQDIFITLKRVAQAYNKNVIMVIDAVQELFLGNRDLSIFDYIIGTGHVYIKYYNMGILITKKDLPEFGIKNHDWGKAYLKRLNIMFQRKDKMFMFNKMFSDVLGVKDERSVKYMHHVYISNRYTEKGNIRLSKHCGLHIDDGNIIRARAICYITWPYKLIKALECIPEIINEKFLNKYRRS